MSIMDDGLSAQFVAMESALVQLRDLFVQHTCDCDIEDPTDAGEYHEETCAEYWLSLINKALPCRRSHETTRI